MSPKKAVAIVSFCLLLLALPFTPNPIVWLPDVLTHHEALLAEARSRNGHRFVITQQWNGVDFYSTYLRHYGEQGKSLAVFVLDADDRKLWTAALQVDETNGKVAVILRGKVVGQLHFGTNTYIRADGIIFPP